MDAVLRGLAIYVFLMVIFRIAGKRTFYEMTPFDFVLLLILAETTQQALLGDDFSITNSVILIITLVSADIGMSLLTARSQRLEKWVEGVPVILVSEGRLLRDRADRARIAEDDILEAARELRGLERMDQIKYAILERSGGITIIPWPSKP